MKDYLLKLQQACSEELFGQEAIEWAVFEGHLRLTGNLDTDARQVFALAPERPGGSPGETNYDRFVEGYRRVAREHHATLLQSYETAGLLEEILRPVATQTTARIRLEQPEPVNA